MEIVQKPASRKCADAESCSGSDFPEYADNRTLALPGDDDGFAAQLRLVTLLHGSVESVYVDTDDFSHEPSGEVR